MHFGRKACVGDWPGNRLSGEVAHEPAILDVIELCSCVKGYQRMPGKINFPWQVAGQKLAFSQMLGAGMPRTHIYGSDTDSKNADADYGKAGASPYQVVPADGGENRCEWQEKEQTMQRVC